MSIRYVGGEPRRIGRGTKRQNVTRWLYVPKEKKKFRFNAMTLLGIMSALAIIFGCSVIVWAITL